MLLYTLQGRDSPLLLRVVWLTMPVTETLRTFALEHIFLEKKKRKSNGGKDFRMNVFRFQST